MYLHVLMHEKYRIIWVQKDNKNIQKRAAMTFNFPDLFMSEYTGCTRALPSLSQQVMSAP